MKKPPQGGFFLSVSGQGEGEEEEGYEEQAKGIADTLIAKRQFARASCTGPPRMASGRRRISGCKASVTGLPEVMQAIL